MTSDELKVWRAKLGFTQARLAEVLGVQRNTVNRWEMGVLNMRPSVLLLIQRIALEHGAPIKPTTKKKEETVKPKRKVKVKGGT
jgi:DNA-binding XRE family transcriptional regulator